MTGDLYELGQYVILFGDKKSDEQYNGSAALVVAYEKSRNGHPLFTIALLGRHFGSYFDKVPPNFMRACTSKTTWDLMCQDDPVLLKDMSGIEFGKTI